MSWAEVNKINSDLSLPLNDLILDTSDNCVRGLKTITGATGYTQNPIIIPGTKTIANVTGKGKITNCLLYYELYTNGATISSNPVADNITLKLTVDNIPILHIKHKTTTPSSTAVCTSIGYIGLVNLKGIYCDYNNLNGTGNINKPINAISLLALDTSGAKRKRMFIDLSSNLQEFTDEVIENNNIQYLVLSEKCIQFNKNFKLEIMTENGRITNYDYLITYKLED